MHARPPVPPFVKQAPQAAAPERPAGVSAAALKGAAAGDDRARAPVGPLLEPVITRLEEIIDQETSALRARTQIDLKSFNDRKSQALLELTRLLRHVQGGAADPQLIKRVGVLQSKLAINRAVLKMHLEAVREIASTLADAIRNVDSDGTYSDVVYMMAKRQ